MSQTTWINRDLTRSVGRLARLGLTESEVEVFTNQIRSILEYVHLLQEVAIQDAFGREILPMVHPHEDLFQDSKNSLREDIILEDQNKLENHVEGFMVPPIL